MAKRVKIDLLDTDIGEGTGISIPEGLPGSPGADGGEEQAAQEEKKGWLNVRISFLRASRARMLFILTTCLLAIAIASGSAWWFYEAQRKAEAEIERAEQSRQAAAVSETMVPFDDLVVDLRDQAGVVRIAFYGICVEFDPPRTAGAVSERIDVRGAIHAVLQRKQVADGLSPEGRALIRRELVQELERLLGERTVKNVYITQFEVI